jgi:anti-sigma regulatory factor (Ser/Thr protein kinase)
MRHALGAFLAVHRIDADLSDDILTAVGEALANSVEHAYDELDQPGDVELYARLGADATLAVDVVDGGRFVEHEARPGRGFGLRIVRAIARTVTVERDGGTRVHMLFAAPREKRPARAATVPA